MAITCYHCRRELALEGPGGVVTVTFRETCTHCGTELHACLNCKFYDTGAYHECREPQAEFVAKKDRGNRCEYFSISTGKGGPAADAKDKALAALDDLFKK